MKVNLEQTREYYQTLTKEDICQCDYCRNYAKLVRDAYPQVSKYLDKFGIDIEKPYELGMPFDDKVNRRLNYHFCMYLVFGSCEDDFSELIDDIEFCKAISFPKPNVEPKEPYFILECFGVCLDMDDEFDFD